MIYIILYYTKTQQSEGYDEYQFVRATYLLLYVSPGGVLHYLDLKWF